MPSITDGLVTIFGSRSASTNIDTDDESIRSQLASKLEQNRSTWSQKLVDSRQTRQNMAPKEVIPSGRSRVDGVEEHAENESISRNTTPRQPIQTTDLDSDKTSDEDVQMTDEDDSQSIDNDEEDEDSSDKQESSSSETPDEINGNNDTDEDDAVEDGTESGSSDSDSSEEDDEDDNEEEGEEEEEDDDEEEEEAKSLQDDGGTNTVSNEAAIESDSEEETEDLDPCLFCKLEMAVDSEDEDVGVIRCKVCRKPAHLKCVETQKTADEKIDMEHWRCTSCAAKQTSESPKEVANKLRHSASRLVRDLLPVSRGIQKPGAHSIFAQPLIQDVEDGGRTLRKRKSPTAEPTPRSEKRKRRTTDGADSRVTDSEINTSEGDRKVAHSTRRSSQKLVPIARILQYRPFHKAPPHKFILAFRLDQTKIEEIVSRPPKPTRRLPRKKQQKILPPPVFQPPVPKFPALPAQHLIFPSMFGDRENEMNAKPYGGILSEAEADTSRSYPQMRDREVFEIARKEAEEERRKTSAAAEVEINGDASVATKPSRTVSGPPSKIKCIQFGKYVIDTSYAAPYPEEYSHESRLFICEFCLKYLPSEFVAYRHKLKCPAKHPPGDEIYRDGSLSIWEVDGRKKTEYCQCLCLMAKLFLGSKTLYYDVDPFLFYILTEYDELGYHFVGYFSKEKRPASQNNVSCILVMPIHQRKGYATFLIDFSYLLTRIEGKEGSPEKPLSDMGLTAYRSYWDLTISNELLTLGDQPFSVKDIMMRTGMTADDVVHSLERLYAFIKDPVTKTYGIRYDKKLYEMIVNKYESKNFQRVRPSRLDWTPYIMGRSDAAILDGQPLHAVAQREEDLEIPDETQAESNEDLDMDDVENISPKTTSRASGKSPRELAAIDDDAPPVNDQGVVAPGPPSTDALNATVPSTITSPNLKTDQHLNGTLDDEVQPALTGYALTHNMESIPAFRYQIDPPIPPSMLRKQTTKKRNPATPQADRNALGLSGTLQPVRSSPRKADSLNGGSSRPSSRDGSPEKFTTPKRRSGRRSGLATEILVAEELEDEDVIDHDDIEKTGSGAADQLENVGTEDSEDSATGADEHSENESEDQDDSSDLDAKFDDDEDDSSSEADSGSEIDVPSAPSVTSALGDEDEEDEEEDDDNDEDE